jgi:hypothetical protein
MTFIKLFKKQVVNLKNNFTFALPFKKGYRLLITTKFLEY